MSAQLLSHSEAAGHRPRAAAVLPDIDAADRDDPLAATMYVCDIFSYWQRCEPMFRVGPEYMSRQVRCGRALHRRVFAACICACVAVPSIYVGGQQSMKMRGCLTCSSAVENYAAHHWLLSISSSWCMHVTHSDRVVCHACLTVLWLLRSRTSTTRCAPSWSTGSSRST